MKKALLFSSIFLISALCVFAYETIIVNFPDGENWEKAYYKKVGNEAILQYVPVGESSDLWNRSIIIHSYRGVDYPINTFTTNNMKKLKRVNPTANFTILKMGRTDSMLTRCTKDYKDVKAQCEFFRTTRAHDGIVTIHYINRDKEDFTNNYTLWFEIIKGAKFLNSYWRNERTFNKSIYFELW